MPDHLQARIKLYLSGFSRDRLAHADGFIAQLAVILADYPAEVVDYVTDPLTGVQRKALYGPNLAEVSKACDARMEELWRHHERQQVAALPPPVDRSKRPDMEEIERRLGRKVNLRRVPTRG